MARDVAQDGRLELVVDVVIDAAQGDPAFAFAHALLVCIGEWLVVVCKEALFDGTVVASPEPSFTYRRSSTAVT